MASLERLTKAQQSRLDLSEIRFRNGVDHYLTVLTAQTDLYTAQQTLVAARMARLTNLVDLYRSLGGGWIEHTGDVPRPAEDVGSIAPARLGATGLFRDKRARTPQTDGSGARTHLKLLRCRFAREPLDECG